MDSDQLVYVSLSVGGEKICFLFGQQSIELKNSVTGKDSGTQAILLPSSIICPACQVKLLNLCIYMFKTRKQAWCAKCSPELSLNLKASYCLWLCPLPTMIVDFLENIRLREEKSPWTKSPLEHRNFILPSWQVCCLCFLQVLVSLRWMRHFNMFDVMLFFFIVYVVTENMESRWRIAFRGPRHGTRVAIVGHHYSPYGSLAEEK